MFTEANPDKGTEPQTLTHDTCPSHTFTEANPDKGTETMTHTVVQQ